MKYMADYLIYILSLENRQNIAVYGIVILLLFEAVIISVAYIRTRMLSSFAKLAIPCKKAEKYKPPVKICGEKTLPHKFEDNGKIMNKGFQDLLSTPSRMPGRN
jgi:hypothetical protein